MSKVPRRRDDGKNSKHIYQRLTPRDRQLLAWLSEHYVLSTPQIARALFDTLRSAQQRLTTLHRLDVINEVHFANADGSPESPNLYLLGDVGLRLHHDAYQDPENRRRRPVRKSEDLKDRLVALGHAPWHLMGVNQFFIDLVAHARRDPGSHLRIWWSEQHATTHFSGPYAGRPLIRPDGFGVWSRDGRTVGFFLEHDRGRAGVPKTLKKLRGYARLTERGPKLPVLFWVPDERRETALQEAMAAEKLRLPVATAVYGDDPAGPVWTLNLDPGSRRALHELPARPGRLGYPDPDGSYPDSLDDDDEDGDGDGDEDRDPTSA